MGGREGGRWVGERWARGREVGGWKEGGKVG